MNPGIRTGQAGEPIVKFDNVDIIFGGRPRDALPLIDQGKTRQEIQEAGRPDSRRRRLYARCP